MVTSVRRSGKKETGKRFTSGHEKAIFVQNNELVHRFAPLRSFLFYSQGSWFTMNFIFVEGDHYRKKCLFIEKKN